MRSSSARLVESRASVSGPLVAEHLDAQRVGQVHPGAARLQQVGGPVPAVGGLEHDLGSGPALASSNDSATGSLSIRTVSPSTWPWPVMRTMTERRRCRSIPTYCSAMGLPYRG